MLHNIGSDRLRFGSVGPHLDTVCCKITGYLNKFGNHHFYSATHGRFVVILDGMGSSNGVMLVAIRFGCMGG